MAKFLARVSIAVWFTFVFQVAHAEPPKIKGSELPEFKAAITEYLNDNDAVAIPALSKMAKGGNVAAQLFLGRIDSLKGSSFLDRLDRKERIKLMRKGGGVFGKPWLSELSSDVPLAKYFLQANRVGEYIEGARGLAKLGENNAAVRAYLQGGLVQGNYQEILKASDQGLMPYQGKYLSWAAALSVPPKESAKKYVREFSRAVRSNDWHVALAVSAGIRAKPKPVLIKKMNQIWPIVFGHFEDQDKIAKENLQTIDKLLAGSSVGYRIKMLCKRQCSYDVVSCSRAAFAAIGGLAGLERSSSPIETFIPNSTYISSRRAEEDIVRKGWRRVSQQSKYSPYMHTSSCFHSLVLTYGK